MKKIVITGAAGFIGSNLVDRLINEGFFYTVNRYVTYNYLDQTWTVGTMDRTAWDDVGTSVTNTIAAGTNNYQTFLQHFWLLKVV